MYVFVGVPVIAYTLAAILLRGYPLTRKVQAETATRLAANEASTKA